MKYRKFYTPKKGSQEHRELVTRYGEAQRTLVTTRYQLETLTKFMREIQGRRLELPSWVGVLVDETNAKLPKRITTRFTKEIRNQAAREFLQAKRGMRLAVARKFGVGYETMWKWAQKFLAEQGIEVPDTPGNWIAPPGTFKPAKRVDFGEDVVSPSSDYEDLRDFLAEVDDD